MPAKLVDLDGEKLAAELHARTLKGQLRTWVARGGSEGSLGQLIKTIATYLQKGYASCDTLRPLLAEVKCETVDAFRGWRDYEERRIRFETLLAGLSQPFEGEGQGSRAAR